ncbi:MAG: trypsin-like peptidase domain-containing protein [Syntrophaceae bacterium]|nr:trypsin-like peptidase domain-containing protein [Syntrophaceae bacterium]
MKTLITILALLSVLLALGLSNSYGLSQGEIKIAARQASVQPSFFIPVLKAYFAKPFEEEKEPTIEEAIKEATDELREEMAELMKEKIEEANEPRHLTTITDLEKYGVLGKSRQEIALGAIAPEWAKFPKNVLVVKKIKKADITAWEKEHEKDVLVISETTGVSPSKAKAMLDKLASEGYQVTKDTEEPDADVVLLHFNGWDDSYPSTLKWEVRVNGGPNLIRGYDPRGILIIQTLPEDSDGEIQRVYVKAGYFDLKEKYKPKTPDEIRLTDQAETLEEKIKELEKKLDDLKVKEEKEIGRDITDATMYDVMYGHVILELYYVRSAASGVYLGDMKVKDEMSGFAWGNYHVLSNEYKGVVLTNSHVAAMMYTKNVYVSKDKEAMWIVYPAFGFIRYTQDSDSYGSPAQVLVIDDLLVDSFDNDCAILVTSSIPGYNKYAAKLGDSDKVVEGLEVVSVGSPMMIQKQITQGIVSNTNYSILKSPIADEWLAKGISRKAFEWVQASRFWVDTTQGAGGASGSPVIALEGSQAGKVIALRNMGIVSRHAIAKPLARQQPDPTYLTEQIGNGPLRLILPKHQKLIFEGFDYRDAIYNADAKDITGENESLGIIMQCGRQNVAGLNGAVPINEIISFLAERGIDVEALGAKRPSGRYWAR